MQVRHEPAPTGSHHRGERAPGDQNQAYHLQRLHTSPAAVAVPGAAGALEQHYVEDALYAAAMANGLVADDPEGKCWPPSGAA